MIRGMRIEKVSSSGKARAFLKLIHDINCACSINVHLSFCLMRAVHLRSQDETQLYFFIMFAPLVCPPPFEQTASLIPEDKRSHNLLTVF